jgi:PRTRC genetic system ThiF family protein
MEDVSDLFEQAYPINFECPLWQEGTNDVQILLIGVGGGGSHLVPMLARAMAVYRKVPMQLTLVDPDTVESRNLDRQNFVTADLDKKKAEVLAARYARAYGVEIVSKSQLVDEPSDISDLLIKNNIRNHPLLIISAVDNLPTRKLIHEFWRYRHNGNHTAFWIDLGGEEFHGQVAFGSIETDNYIHNGVTVPWITEVYPDILEEAGEIKPSQLPCGMGAAQAMNRNISGAVLAMNPILALFESWSKEENLLPKYHLIEYGINSPVTRVRRNTLTELNKVTWAGRTVITPGKKEGKYDNQYLTGLVQQPERLAA